MMIIIIKDHKIMSCVYVLKRSDIIYISENLSKECEHCLETMCSLFFSIFTKCTKRNYLFFRCRLLQEQLLFCIIRLQNFQEIDLHFRLTR